ncbi:hypothetical protein SDC9_109187 [bioreactor metagenome]|uniref:Uncharacterized protein n=1 Tax=bioreactor metagenome TaxID=1076179 RepID=A0A645BCE4_9ZZZZ
MAQLFGAEPNDGQHTEQTEAKTRCNRPDRHRGCEGEDADVGDQEAGDQFTATLARHVEDEHQQGDGHDIGEHQIRIHGGTFRVMSSCVNHSVRRSLVPSMTHLCVAYEPVVPIGLGRREDH